MYEQTRQKLVAKVDILNAKQNFFEHKLQSLSNELEKQKNKFEELNANSGQKPEPESEVPGTQPNFQIKSELLKKGLLEKGLEPGHMEILTEIVQPMLNRYASLEFISDIIKENQLTVKEFEVLNACTKKFSGNMNNIFDYIEMIRKYDVTVGKVEVFNKIVTLPNDQTNSMEDFKSAMEAMSKYPLTESYASLVKEHLVFHTVSDFKGALEVFSKYTLNKDQTDKLVEALMSDDKSVVVNDLELLETTVCNLEKYEYATKPWTACLLEILGVTYGNKEGDSLSEGGEALVQPAQAEPSNDS